MKKLLIFSLLLFPSVLLAQDFGLLLGQNASLGNNTSGETEFNYTASLVPRFSLEIGEGDLYLSAQFSIEYKENDYSLLPELLRTEYSLQKGAFGFRVGRIVYEEPLGFIANGLFDGFEVTHSSKYGQFGLGAFFTRLLYKKAANITITQEDNNNFLLPDTYFAPNRVLAGINWEHLSLMDVLRLKISLLAQIDVTGNTEKFHSQYFIVNALLPVSDFIFEAGTSVMAAQSNDNLFMALAFDGGIIWTLPTSFASNLAFNFRYGSGQASETFGVFVPVTNKYFSDIFQAKITGLTVLSLKYTARAAKTIGASLAVSYYVRNDVVTQNSYPVTDPGDGGCFLGGEPYAQILWSPVSDVQFILGCGVFLPSLGNNWQNENPVWKLSLQAVLGLY